MGVVNTVSSAILSSPRAFGIGVVVGLIGAAYYKHKFTNLKQQQNQNPLT